MKRAAVLLLSLALLAAGCGGGGDDDEADDILGDDTTTTVNRDADLPNQGKEAFTAYITALVGGDYQVALDHSVGSAAAVAGYFNTTSRIPNLPADFKVPKRQAELTWPEGRATRNPDGTVTLDHRVSASLTGGGADEQTTYSGIKLREEKGKLVVDDFVRGEDGPVSEDVYRTEGEKGEGNGIAVQMGPGFGMRGAIGQGGVRFTNFVFAYTNNTQFTVTLRNTEDNVLNFVAALDTDVKRYRSRSTAGTEAAPGATGFGFVYFNDQVEGQGGILTMEFVDEDDDEYEVKVSLNTM